MRQEAALTWDNVTPGLLIDIIREEDWSTPPRSLPEFFHKFTLPASFDSWKSRFKCNLYYYRTNYYILMVSIFVMAFLRMPLALFSSLLAAINMGFFNDSFACTFSDQITRIVWNFSPRVAVQMRPPPRDVRRNRSISSPPPRSRIYICGQPRWVLVSIFALVSFSLWTIACDILVVLWASAIAILGIAIHATFRKSKPSEKPQAFRRAFANALNSVGVDSVKIKKPY